MALVSQRAYARHRGVTHRAVQVAIATGRISTVDGKVDPEVADREWRARTDETKVHNSVSGNPHQRRVQDAPPMPAGSKAEPDPAGAAGAKGYAAARTASESVRARLLMLEYKKKSGEVVPAEDVRVGAFNAARRARDLLAAIPDRVAPVLVGLPSDDIQRRLAAEIETVCAEIARWASPPPA